jgi:hypothetical protein
MKLSKMNFDSLKYKLFLPYGHILILYLHFKLAAGHSDKFNNKSK